MTLWLEGLQAFEWGTTLALGLEGEMWGVYRGGSSRTWTALFAGDFGSKCRLLCRESGRKLGPGLADDTSAAPFVRRNLLEEAIG